MTVSEKQKQTSEKPAQAKAGVPQEQPILVVDDESTMQALATTILEKLGHPADAVGSGEDAIAKYKEALEDGKPYAAVVMDLALPGGISGLEATIAIKQLDPNAKIVVSSGYLEQQATSIAN